MGSSPLSFPADMETLQGLVTQNLPLRSHCVLQQRFKTTHFAAEIQNTAFCSRSQPQLLLCSCCSGTPWSVHAGSGFPSCLPWEQPPQTASLRLLPWLFSALFQLTEPREVTALRGSAWEDNRGNTSSVTRRLGTGLSCSLFNVSINEEPPRSRCWGFTP